MKPCKYCDSDGECYLDCECAKCQDPEGYAIWKNKNPEDYESWLESQNE